MFDRSMTIAAQFFTSVFPILILFTTWADSRDADWLADALNVPEETRSVLEDATEGAGGAAFGVAGTVILLPPRPACPGLSPVPSQRSGVSPGP